MDAFPFLEAGQRRSSVVPALFVLAKVVVGGDPRGPMAAWLEAVYEDQRGGTCSRLPATRTALTVTAN